MLDRIRNSVSNHPVAYFILFFVISMILAFLFCLPYCLATSFSEDSLFAVGIFTFLILEVAGYIFYEDDGLEYM